MIKRVSVILTAVLTSVFFTAALAPAQSSKPLDFENFIKIQRVTDPQPSPDGKWVVQPPSRPPAIALRSRTLAKVPRMSTS